MSVKVSIVMPACNVEKYLRECMDSVVGQTLKDIEIICVDDGSKDSTGAILDEYAAADPRVKVIHKVNTGYGNSMNVGIDAACGEYIGIVETDDFAEADMFERLYIAAKKYDADVVKSNFFSYVSKPEPKNTFTEVLKDFNKYDQVFCPLENDLIYKVRACIWSGIYRRQMLIDENVRFNETPGASYQDTSFAFKMWTAAKRAVLVKEAYLHYRTDNSSSSVKNMTKIFCICDEYAEIDRYLAERPKKREKLEKVKNYTKYETYRWNFDRLILKYKWKFLKRMKAELLEAEKNGYLDKAYFMDFQWKRLQKMLHKTHRYFIKLVYDEKKGKNK